MSEWKVIAVAMLILAVLGCAYMGLPQFWSNSDNTIHGIQFRPLFGFRIIGFVTEPRFTYVAFWREHWRIPAAVTVYPNVDWQAPQPVTNGVLSKY